MQPKPVDIDKPNANCAVMGIWGIEEASTLAYLGLYALQHRGQEAAGIVSSDGQDLYRFARQGLAADVFKRREILVNLKGDAAIGHNRYSTTGPSSSDNVQPLLVTDRSGPVAMSHNGNLVNYVALRKFLEDEGSLFRTTSDSELILQLMARAHAPTFHERLEEALKVVRGAYSLAMLTKKSLIAVRDEHGVRPMCIGKLKTGWIVSSETCALDLLGAEYMRDLEPGEMVIFNEDGMQSRQIKHTPKKAHCVFEYIYFSRPDSKIFENNVDKVRRRLGHTLAKKHPAPDDIDCIISVPDSSNTAALGYAHESGKPFEIALIRNHYVGRTFIEPEQKMRDFGVKIKFNPVAGVLKGKKVVVVEDSIVRGTTLRKLTGLIREAGAMEVHVRVSSPPITNPCYYGMDFPTKKELMAAWHSVDEIREYIGADSLEYLSVEELLDTVPNGKDVGYCNACFSGIYPIRINGNKGKVKLDAGK